jgi:hypothetical protein
MAERETPWLTPRRRNRLWILAIGLMAAGGVLLPREVDVQIEPRRDREQPYWRGALRALSVRDGAFFLQTLINRYPSPPLPFPHQTPPYRVRFTTHLHARAAGSYHFELDSPWDGALDVEGQRVFGSGPFSPGGGRDGEIELVPGVHTATLLVQPGGDVEVPIRLLWREPGGKLRPFVASDVAILDGGPGRALLGRLAVPLLASGVLLFLAATLFWAFRIEDARPRDAALAAALLAGIALFARAAHFDTYPRTNLDETHNAWAGFNLLHEGTPKSWSWLPVYRNTRVTWFSYEYPMVDASFDHPPLLPLLTGLEATVLGARSMYDCRLPVIRPLMLVVGTAAVVVFFLVALELTGFGTAFLAALLMATSPLVVFGSRLVKEDNLVQLFLLAALLCYLLGRRVESRRPGWMTAVFSGLAALAKAMGVAVGFALAAAALGERRGLPAAARILMGTLVLASLFPLYGAAIDGETYGRVLNHLASAYPQETFADKFLILPRLILEPKVSAVTPLLDGWILLGWLSVFRLARLRPIPVLFVSYLLILMLSVSSRYLWGFYLSPVLPFLCLAAALQLRHTFVRQDLLSIFLMVALAFLPQYAMLSGAPMPYGFRGMLFLSSLPLVPALFRLPPEHVARRASRVVLAALLVVSVAANLHRCLTTL